MWFVTLIMAIIALGIAVAIGARFHTQVNAKIARMLGKDEGLPPDFELWLAQHKGEYDSIGKAIAAWADAKYGDKYAGMLK